MNLYKGESELSKPTGDYRGRVIAASIILEPPASSRYDEPSYKDSFLYLATSNNFDKVILKSIDSL